MPTTVVDFDTALRDAAACYLERKARTAHPDGSTDNGGRWYPADAERQPCCSTIRTPSRAHPWSLMLHCRTLAHIAWRYDVDEAALRRAVRRQTPTRTVQRQTRYKVVRVVAQEPPSPPIYRSLYDAAYVYALDTTYRQAAKPDHEGGWYVRPLLWQDTPHFFGDAVGPRRTLEDAFRRGDIIDMPPPGTYAILECDVWGRCIEYSNGKEAWTYLKPVAVHSTFTID